MNNFGYSPYQYGYVPNQYAPYSQPQPQPQQSIQQNQQIGVPCCEVNSEDDILPMNVPSNGTYALFATKDGSTIYRKFINKYGLIDTITYRCENKTEEEKPNPYKEILDRLEKIEETLTSWSK